MFRHLLAIVVNDGLSDVLQFQAECHRLPEGEVIGQWHKPRKQATLLMPPGLGSRRIQRVARDSSTHHKQRNHARNADWGDHPYNAHSSLLPWPARLFAGGSRYLGFVNGDPQRLSVRHPIKP